MKNNIKGITLMALVITIIVLLILASVTITTISGDNGILTNAVWAAFATEMTELDERIKIKEIENSEEILSNEAKPIFTVPVEPTSLPKSLKMEIIYIREGMPTNKEPTKEYYIENLLDYLIDETGKVEGLYYVPDDIAQNNTTYIYDQLTNTAFKVNVTRLKGKAVHSYKYGCRVMGSGYDIEMNEKDYVMKEESEIVTVGEETYYAPNLEGFNALTTSAIYYNEDFSKTYEVGITLHMNQEVINYIEDGNTKYTWYDYANKIWANIKTTANGYEAWWVWIPRYAYKIGEVTDTKKPPTTEIIYVDTNNKPLNTEKYGSSLPEGYQVHPAFTTDKELKGIWIAKYDPSYGKNKTDDLEMTKKVMEPDLTGFDRENTYLIKYEENGNTTETKLSEISNLEEFNSDQKWYDYENKVWANIKTIANGYEAWWVWIPRYAYRLPDNPNDDTEIIFIDTENRPLDTEKFGNTIPDGFTVHPAFDQDTDANGKKLSGIWVAKYDPTHVNDTTDDLELSDKTLVPDMSGFDRENTYLIKYEENGSTAETKLSEVSSLEEFNSDKKWYDYENKLWANIKTTANGQEAWWVWIPRYAYRLPDNPNDDTEIIFVDINDRPLDTEKYGDVLPLDFTVHPAFNQDTDSNGNKLSGIWVAKYKPSKTE